MFFVGEIGWPDWIILNKKSTFFVGDPRPFTSRIRDGKTKPIYLANPSPPIKGVVQSMRPKIPKLSPIILRPFFWQCDTAEKIRSGKELNNWTPLKENNICSNWNTKGLHIIHSISTPDDVTQSPHFIDVLNSFLPGNWTFAPLYRFFVSLLVLTKVKPREYLIILRRAAKTHFLFRESVPNLNVLHAFSSFFTTNRLNLILMRPHINPSFHFFVSRKKEYIYIYILLKCVTFIMSTTSTWMSGWQ